MTKEEFAKKKNAQINNALGIFILFFGIVILIATVYTETLIGELTNLVAGIILCAIGLGMVVRSLMVIKIISKNSE